MDPKRPAPEPPETSAAREREHTLAERIAAAIVLAALLGAGGLVSWWILTDQVDFRRAAGVPAAERAEEGEGAP